MIFQAEKFSEIDSEIKDLVQDHWEEVAVLKDKMPLDINWEHYRQCDERGILQVTTARLTSGKLVGYWFSIINQHPHYWNTKCAFQDVYFVHPEYRKANTGLQLMAEMEKNVRAMGAKVMIGSDKESKSMAPLFEFSKWQSVGTQYMKWIGGD